MSDSEHKKWVNQLFRADEMTQGDHLCIFSEFDKYGDNQDCWFKPGPETCQLCLLGQLAEHLGMIRNDLMEINEKLEEASLGG